MDLNSAWIFVRVVQAGSFSGAARQLRMPVSTVSTKVSQLEERLGASLLRRTTRQLHLTDAGARYFEHAVRACAEVHQAEASTTLSQEKVHGRILVTAPTEMGSTSLSETISDFLRAHPEVQIELLLTDRIVDLLAEGVDLAIRVGNLADSSLVAKKIGMTEFHAYASPAYLKKAGEPRRPRDLSEHDCLSFQSGVESAWELSDGAREVSVPVKGPFASNNLIASHRLTLSGRGIALLPDYLCAEDVSRGKLKRVLPGWSAERFPVHLVHPEQRYVPMRIRALIDYLSSNLREVF